MVKRYDPDVTGEGRDFGDACPCMTESACGDYVLAHDYDTLAAERDLIVIRAENAERALEQREAQADKDVIERNRVIAEKSARLAEAVALLREARASIPGNHAFALRRIDAFLAATTDQPTGGEK